MAKVLPETPMAKSSMVSTVKAYSIPAILLSASLFCQLVVIPRSFPPSHYDVLGIKMHSSIEEVTEAYHNLLSRYSDGELLDTAEFIKIQYAFELLTNQLWKRDYDIYGIDEQIHAIEEAKEKYVGLKFSEINLPLLKAVSYDSMDNALEVITPETYLSKLESNTQLLIQVFSLGSNRCAQFSNHWKRIANLLDGVAMTGIIELGNVQLATHLAEKKSTGQPFFRNGLPSLMAVPAGCKTSNCLIRFMGEPSVDAITDWFATTVLSLPRIPYYSKESLVQTFLGKGSRHKVKVIFISKTGERATPFVRQAAKSYWAYASFAFALWREEESSFWWNMFGVESSPAIVFLKDPGVKPVVYHGPLNNSWFVNIMEQNKHQVLPQLRSVTAKELGCDARGYSRAGNDTKIWYCVVLVGRQSRELDKMRETMRRVQDILSNDEDAHHNPSSAATAALKQKRMTFTWLDGEVQNRHCFYYVRSEYNYETCGPRRDIRDVPQLFIIRYKRNDTEDSEDSEKYPKNYLAASLGKDMDPTSQLVANYNGSNEIKQIIQWISQVIRDGDTTDLPFVRTRTPELVPEDADPIWSIGTEKFLSSSKGMRQKVSNIIIGIYDLLGDPRIGPILLLGALMSFGSIWLRRNKKTNPSESEHLSTKDEVREKPRFRPERGSTRYGLPTMTDVDPKDGYQMPFSDSDSD